jgi:hypothetical protein
MPKSLYCNFFKSVGHDDKYCKTMELLRERTPDTYKVQVEMMTMKDAPEFNQIRTPYKTMPQYNTTQPQHNPTQYNQVPQYNAPRGDRIGYRGGG